MRTLNAGAVNFSAAETASGSEIAPDCFSAVLMACGLSAVIRRAVPRDAIVAATHGLLASAWPQLGRCRLN